LHGEPVTARVLGFVGLSQSFGGFAAASIGLLGWLLFLVLLCGVLSGPVMAGDRRADGARVRGVIEMLAVAGL